MFPLLGDTSLTLITCDLLLNLAAANAQSVSKTTSFKITTLIRSSRLNDKFRDAHTQLLKYNCQGLLHSKSGEALLDARIWSGNERVVWRDYSKSRYVPK